jgi:putative oxidoreductase
MEILGYLVLRFVFGLIFVLHGCQHVLTSFGGSKGLKGSEETVARLGFKPVWLWSRLFGFGMLSGGLSVFFGAFTHLGAATLISIMAVAVLANKLPRGFWNKNNGYEYNLSLIGGLTAAGLFGPGPISFDAMFGLPLVNPGLFVAALIIFLAIASLGFVTREPAQQPARH